METTIETIIETLKGLNVWSVAFRILLSLIFGCLLSQLA